jgi:hypothetical protein
LNEIDFSKYAGVTKPAAFGYYFGLTPEQIQEAGIDLESQSSEGKFSVFKAASAPLAWHGTEDYRLFFFNNTLSSVKGVGRHITGDPTGSRGKDAYKELLTALTEKYGKPKSSYHKVGGRLFKDPHEFYQCLAYDGCGLWLDMFNLPDRTILLQLKGVGRGTGFITLAYDAEPEWSNAMEQNNADKRETTKKGL